VFALTPSDLDSRDLDHESLFHWNDLKEIEDQIKFFQLEENHQKFELDLASQKYAIDQRLYQKQAIAELELKESQMNFEVKTANLEAAGLKVKERLIYIEIKKQTLAKKNSKKELKKTAQLYADDWKAKYELGQVLIKRAQSELNYANLVYDRTYKLKNSDSAISLEEFLEATQKKKEKEANVSMLMDRVKSLYQTYEEAQKLADQL
ncbi:MAG: hypothetical protein ACKOA8_08210, partial [Deltaproteobacteria bacterium]